MAYYCTSSTVSSFVTIGRKENGWGAERRGKVGGRSAMASTSYTCKTTLEEN